VLSSSALARAIKESRPDSTLRRGGTLVSVRMARTTSGRRSTALAEHLLPWPCRNAAPTRACARSSTRAARFRSTTVVTPWPGTRLPDLVVMVNVNGTSAAAASGASTIVRTSPLGAFRGPRSPVERVGWSRGVARALVRLRRSTRPGVHRDPRRTHSRSQPRRAGSQRQRLPRRCA